MLADMRENLIQLMSLLWQRFDVSQYLALHRNLYARMCVDDRFYFTKEELIGKRIDLPYLLNAYALRANMYGYFLVHIEDDLVQVLFLWDVCRNLRGDYFHMAMYLEIDFEKNAVCFLSCDQVCGLIREEGDDNKALLKDFLRRMNFALYFHAVSEDNDKLMRLIDAMF